MYGAILPVEIDKQRHYARKRFFNALQRDGILVCQGYCYQSDGRLVQKGVDMLMDLDLYALGQQQYQLLFVFSGDSDFISAIHRARKNNSKVIAILRDNQPAGMMKEHVDAVVSLENIISLINDEHIVHRSKNNNNQIT
ncbi:NYN domain-containing protein [Aneurinibacillus thermoaerophilus]|uniref:NYN domain-containing protein n=1 Tax=Aneurinibacillus thermoaerophilus TaxID=143495 RepID=UPI002E1C6337|nr:NYN domain-containing protein [Aneurinibacillus thermoaerophilus]MED0677635.1 NYN domain-containing protein [Aneurinibacillus thermoaerophilus]